MTSIKNILVALDLTQLDDKLIEYAAYVANMYHAENVYFVHNIKRFALSDLFKKELESLNLDDMIEKKIHQNVERHFNSNISYEILISDDPYTESLITYISNKYLVNLVMVGNKNSYKGTGSVAGRLLRMLQCDVLSVPKTAKVPAENVLCTSDFSSKSNKGIRRAIDFTEKAKGSIHCLNVHKFPVQYFPVLDLNDAKERIEKHTQQSFKKLFAKIKTDKIQPISAIAGEKSVPEKIRTIAEEEYDILFMADRGQNNFTSLLVGSTTEEIFTHYLTVPLWVVK